MRRKVVAVWVSLLIMVSSIVILVEIAERVEAPYIPHDPFRINSNAEFASIAVIEGWGGDGSPGNPYIIEGYDINGSGYGYCIYIGNTTYYFEVRDCYLHEANGVGSLPFFPDSGIMLYNVQYCTIFNNTVSSCNLDGVFILYSSNNIIINNNVSSSNYYGIHIYNSESNTITNNTASSSNSVGIALYASLRNTVANNTASSNILGGIGLSSSSNNTISNNTASSNNDFGFSLWKSNSNIISDNNASNNKDGIYLELTNSNNTIVNNTVFSNHNYGINIEDSSSINNRIYHNNIINNTNQAYDNTNNGNQWNNGYPLGGNYWYDYIGVDKLKGPNQDIHGSDGIGDTPYIIDADSQDKYPLMQPYRPLNNYLILKQGWNLISLPFIQEEQNLTRVLGSINGWYDVVQWYNIKDSVDLWKHNKLGKPFGNDLFELNETMSFWIHITQPGDTIFMYNGTEPTSNQTIQLHPGWNMVGYPSLTSHNRTTGLNNLTFDTHVDCIQWYDAATKTWHFMGPDDSFVPGRGYWVHSKVDAEWEVPL
jgi:parallel beta-helix repeat protein